MRVVDLVKLRCLRQLRWADEALQVHSTAWSAPGQCKADRRVWHASLQRGMHRWRMVEQALREEERRDTVNKLQQLQAELKTLFQQVLW